MCEEKREKAEDDLKVTNMNDREDGGVVSTRSSESFRKKNKRAWFLPD